MPPTYYVAMKHDLMDYVPEYCKDPRYILGFITGFSFAAVLFSGKLRMVQP